MERKYDKRIPEILKQVSRLAGGEYGGYIAVSDRFDEIDGISAGLNHLSDVLEGRDKIGKDKEKRIAELLRVARQFELGNFDERCPVSKYRDSIDRLAEAINRLVEEFAQHPKSNGVLGV
jgi:methyl-accepting chemotaxis protein